MWHGKESTPNEIYISRKIRAVKDALKTLCVTSLEVNWLDAHGQTVAQGDRGTLRFEAKDGTSAIADATDAEHARA